MNVRACYCDICRACPDCNGHPRQNDSSDGSLPPLKEHSTKTSGPPLFQNSHSGFVDCTATLSQFRPSSVSECIHSYFEPILAILNFRMCHRSTKFCHAVISVTCRASHPCRAVNVMQKSKKPCPKGLSSMPQPLLRWNSQKVWLLCSMQHPNSAKQTIEEKPLWTNPHQKLEFHMQPNQAHAVPHPKTSCHEFAVCCTSTRVSLSRIPSSVKTRVKFRSPVVSSCWKRPTAQNTTCKQRMLFAILDSSLCPADRLPKNSMP